MGVLSRVCLRELESHQPVSAMSQSDARQRHSRADSRGQEITEEGDAMEEPIYKEGYPEKQGWFDVLIDGVQEDRLQHWVCQVYGRHHWKDTEGNYIEALHTVTWTGEPSRYP